MPILRHSAGAVVVTAEAVGIDAAATILVAVNAVVAYADAVNAAGAHKKRVSHVRHWCLAFETAMAAFATLDTAVSHVRHLASQIVPAS